MTAPVPTSDEERRPDLAQVVLRALLAWPLVALFAASAAWGLLVRLRGDVHADVLVVFALGAGLGAGLVFAVAEAALLRARSRRPGVAVGIVGLLAPAALLAGDFARLRVETGSSAEATRALVARHDVVDLFELDEIVTALVLLAPLLLARARGLTPVAQAAVGAVAVAIWLVVRLAAGWLVEAPLSLVATFELSLVVAAPFELAAADRLVTGLRAWASGAEAPSRRLGATLGLALSAPAVALVWCQLAPRGPLRGSLRLVTGHGWPVAVAVVSAIASSVALRAGARPATLFVAATVCVALAIVATGGVGLLLALPIGLGLLLPALARGLRDACAAPPAARRERAARVVLAAVLLAVAATTLSSPTARGGYARARLAIAAGADPAPALRALWLDACGRGSGRSSWMRASRSIVQYIPGSWVERMRSSAWRRTPGIPRPA